MSKTDYPGADDNLLVKLTLDGDSLAFGEIVRRYEGVVARTVMGMLGDIPEADDVGQEAFIRLHRSLKYFRGEAGLGTYIQRIAINLSINEIKKRKRIISLFVRSDDEKARERDIAGMCNPTEDFDVSELIQNAISSLRPEYRSIVVLRLIHEYTTKECAEILDLPQGTVLSRLSRARDQLKLLLDSVFKPNA